MGAEAESPSSRELVTIEMLVSCEKGGSMITVEAKKVGARVIATVKVGIGTGQYSFSSAYSVFLVPPLTAFDYSLVG
jgi:hypothetical protein